MGEYFLKTVLHKLFKTSDNSDYHFRELNGIKSDTGEKAVRSNRSLYQAKPVYINSIVPGIVFFIIFLKNKTE
jgi:hypothetical protein